MGRDRGGGMKAVTPNFALWKAVRTGISSEFLQKSWTRLPVRQSGKTLGEGSRRKVARKRLKIGVLTKLQIKEIPYEEIQGARNSHLVCFLQEQTGQGGVLLSLEFFQKMPPLPLPFVSVSLSLSHSVCLPHVIAPHYRFLPICIIQSLVWEIKNVSSMPGLPSSLSLE